MAVCVIGKGKRMSRIFLEIAVDNKFDLRYLDRGVFLNATAP